MLIEYGLLPEEPGMEECYTIIGEEMKMNPRCPCPTRTCPNHGYCQYCIIHHDNIRRKKARQGQTGHPPYCQRKKEDGG